MRVYERGTYVADKSPERFTPPSDAWVARVQMPLSDGTVRLVAPHGVEWTARVTDLRKATDAERVWFDAFVPRRPTGAAS